MPGVANPAENEDRARVRAAIARVARWRHRIEVAPGVVTPGSQNSQRLLSRLSLPEELTGKRVLDVGASDGFYSFTCEARGADVVAIDARSIEATGFGVARELLGSSVPYHQFDVYELLPETFGRFDVVLFLGVLYHLRHPLLALDRLAAVCEPGARMWVVSVVMDGDIHPLGKTLSDVAPELVDVPMAQFYPTDEPYVGAWKWWGPNVAGLRAMVEAAGFSVERVVADRVPPTRAIVEARRNPS
jgi:tRNA (mo5U34)-methyltransferase